MAHQWKTCPCDGCKMRRRKVKTKRRNKDAWATVHLKRENERRAKRDAIRERLKSGVPYTDEELTGEHDVVTDAINEHIFGKE